MKRLLIVGLSSLLFCLPVMAEPLNVRSTVCARIPRTCLSQAEIYKEVILYNATSQLSRHLDAANMFLRMDAEVMWQVKTAGILEQQRLVNSYVPFAEYLVGIGVPEDISISVARAWLEGDYAYEQQEFPPYLVQFLPYGI